MLRGRLVEGREGEGRKGRLGATPVEGREGEGRKETSQQCTQ